MNGRVGALWFKIMARYCFVFGEVSSNGLLACRKEKGKRIKGANLFDFPGFIDHAATKLQKKAGTRPLNLKICRVLRVLWALRCPSSFFFRKLVPFSIDVSWRLLRWQQKIGNEESGRHNGADSQPSTTTFVKASTYSPTL
jgi:hypothetical protein